MKAFVYLRVSGRDQIDGDGFDRQLLACQTYASQHGIEVAEVFREKGVSGTKDLDDRPALSELFVALEENGIKTVIIEKLDRLARDLMVQEAIIKDFMQHEYMLISAYEPDLCSNEPTRKLIRQVIGAISEYDKTMIVQRLRAARQRKKLRGERGEGRHGYGEKPGEAEHLQFMQQCREVGMRFTDIADALNDRGVTSRMGTRWRGTTVAKIMGRNAQKHVA